MEKTKIYNNLNTYLINRDWELKDANDRYDIFKPPLKLEIEEDYRLFIPKQTDKFDFNKNIEKTLEILSDIYEQQADDMFELIIENKQILKFHIENEAIKDAKPPIGQFQNYISKIRNLLYESASFAILKKPHIFEKEVEEAERYINYCRFIRNEKGSLITKVELPNEEEIKIKNLFDLSIEGHFINETFFNVVDFINSNLLKEEPAELEDIELKNNQGFISVNITEKLHDFYKSIELNNLEFELLRIQEPKKLIVKDLNEKKLSNLSNFAQEVKKKLNEIKSMSLAGKVILLKSGDVEGNKNTIKIKTIIDNVKWDVIVTLSSEEYHRAIHAHDTNQTVKITGILEKRKTDYKVTELDEFEIVGKEKNKNEVNKIF